MRYQITIAKRLILLERGIAWIEFHEIGITRAIRVLGGQSLFRPLLLSFLVHDFYTIIDPKIHHYRPMSYSVFVENKAVNFLAQRINSFLSITNTRDASFHLE